MRVLSCVLTLIIVIAVFSSCGGASNFQNKKNNGTNYNAISGDTIRIANDSLEYEIMIIEPGFNSWLATQPSRGYWAQSSMDIQNDIKVPLYNLRVDQPFQYDPQLYPFRIDYDSSIDYGYEVTYLLFNYFRFFEQRYNQRL